MYLLLLLSCLFVRLIRMISVRLCLDVRLSVRKCRLLSLVSGRLMICL